MFKVTPKRNGQFACQGHNANAPHSASASGESLIKPSAEFALGLEPQPAPGYLDSHCSDSFIAGFTDPLFPLTPTTVIRCRRQAGEGSYLLSVMEFPPPEKFHNKNPDLAI